jgi:hypothetical protein
MELTLPLGRVYFHLPRNLWADGRALRVGWSFRDNAAFWPRRGHLNAKGEQYKPCAIRSAITAQKSPRLNLITAPRPSYSVPRSLTNVVESQRHIERAGARMCTVGRPMGRDRVSC